MMTAYDFLSVDDVLYIHRRQLERFGGGDGLRASKAQKVPTPALCIEMQLFH